MKENTREKQLINNTLVLAIGNISTKCMTFLLVPIYTNYLTPEDFGLVDLLNVFILLLVPIVSAQLSNGMFRFLINTKEVEEKKKIVTNVIFSVLIFSTIFLIICFFIQGISKIQYFNLLAIGVVTNIFSEIELQYARGEGDFAVYTISSVIISAVTVFCNIVLIIFFKYGGKSILISAIAAYMCGALYVVFKTKNYKYLSVKKIDKKVIKKLLVYSVPLIPNQLSWWITNTSDRLIVTSVLGVSANGILGVAHKLPSIYTTMFNVFNITWAESVCRAITDSDAKEYINRMFVKSVTILLELVTIVITGIPIIFDWYVGEKYMSSYNLILILCMAMFINSMGSLYGGIYLAKRQSREIAISTIIGAIVNIVVHVILIKPMGLYAAAISTLVSYLVIYFIRKKQCKEIVQLTINKHLIISYAICGMAIVSYVINVKRLCIVLLVFELCVFGFCNRTVIISFLNKKMKKESIR